MKQDNSSPRTPHLVPTHLGLILDGNRRWASDNGLPKLEGHKKGYENLKVIADAALEHGVEYLSAYIFSTENWSRAKAEVGYLMKLVVEVFTKDIGAFMDRDVRIVFLGSKDGLSKTVLKAMKAAEEKTKDNSRGTLALCFNYGGKQEIVDAMKHIIDAKIPAHDVDEALIASHLYDPDIPPIDLMIRTSGEQRTSNFMLWRLAYSELYFTDKHWPAFSAEDLDEALAEYSRRQRRFGE